MKPKFRSLINAFAPLRHTSLIVCVVLGASAAVHADQTWTGATDDSWITATNWSGTAIPGASDLVIFDSSSTANLDNYLDADFSIAGLQMTSPSGPISINNNTLTLGASGIDMSTATQPLTIASSVALGVNQTWTTATDLTISGVVSGDFSLTKAGAGTLFLNAAANTYTGDTSVTEGILNLGADGSITSPGFVILGDGAELSVPKYLTAGAGSQLLVDADSTATLTMRSGGGYQKDVGAFGSGATLNVNLAFNNNITSFQGTWKATDYLDNLNVVTQPGTRNQVRLRMNGGGFDGTNFTNTDVSIQNTRFYVTTYSSGNTVFLGSLTGTADAELSGGDAGGGATYSIGRVGAPDTVFSGWFSDNGVRTASVIKTDTSKLTIGGNCTNTGAWTIVDGVLQFGEGGATGAPGTGAIIVDSNGIDGGSLVFDRSGSYTIAGSVSGIGPIFLGGGADATFSGNNSFTGVLTVTGGSLAVSALANGGLNSGLGASSSDAANVILNGASLRYTGAGGSTDRNFTIGTDGAGFGASGSGAVTYSSTAPLVLDGTDAARTITLSGSSLNANTFAPQIEDNGTGATSLTKSGAGSWTLTGANTYSGGTSIDGGTLILSNGSGSATGSGAISVQAGATLGGNGSAAGGANVASGGTLVPGTSVGTLTLGALTLESGSTADFELQDGGPNDLVVVSNSGGLTINGGGLNLYQPGTANSVSAPGVFNLFQYNGSIGGTGVGALSVLNPAAGVNYAFGVSGGFVQVTVSLAALPNTWNVDADGTWGTGSNWTTGIPDGAGETVNFLGSIMAPRTITLDGGRTAGQLQFDNVFSYTIAPDTGSLTLDNSGSPASVAVGLGDHAVNVPIVLSTAGLEIDVADATSITFGGEVSGTAAIVKNNDGLLVLNGSNIFNGGVSINAGSVQIGANSALGSGGLSFLGDSSLVLGATDLAIGNTVSIASGIAGEVDTNGFNATLNNVISGDGSLIKAGAGVLSLANTNTYTGGTTFTGGLIEFANADNLGSGDLFFDGGGLRWATGNTLDPSTLFTDFLAGGAIFDTNGNDIEVAGNVGGTGPGRLTKQGAGTLTLAFGQTFEGGVSVLGGTLSIEDVTALGTSPLAPTPGHLVIDDAILETTFPMTLDVNRGVTLGGAATITLADPADTMGIDGIIDGTGSLSLQGGGTWILGSANTYSGGTTLAGGELQIATGATVGTGLLTLDGTFRMNASDGTTYDVPNNIDIPSGTSSTMWLSGRVNLGGTYTGAADSTLNLEVRYVRDTITGNMSGFDGQINVNASQTGTGDFRLNNNNGFGRLNLSDGVYMYQAYNPPSGSGTQTVQNIGELSGTTGAILGGNPVGGRFVNWTIGALNTDSTFAGVIQNDIDASNGFGEPIITKVGTGTLTLSNVNTYTGPTRVLGGTLALDASGSIDSSTALTVGAAGVLDVTAKTTFAIPATQTVTFNLDGLNAGASGRIDATGLELDITNAVVDFTIGDPLDDAVYILADYGTLTGGAFASVTLPVGYAIDYAYNGGTQIALVQSASTYDTWAGSFSLIGGPGDDDDLDGIANGIEFVIGGDPTTATEGGKMPTLTRSGGNMVFVFRRTSESASFNPTVQHGSDLASPWTTAADGVDGVTIVEETDGFETGVDKVTVTIPTVDAKHFARLNVVIP